ncbi:calcium-activated chloride channel regulator 1-like [Diadema antillarum]|uniref:calcium-activated chloride channel regulator 1-like n=1 Tax=Diadema antillarum TaxID=105358 RepID=UPI003A8C71B0
MKVWDILAPWLFLGLAAEMVASQGGKFPIKLENGGYSDVLIAIVEGVPEDQALIENIKEMYTSASELQYNASRQHVYWKEIKILVPPTWSPQEHYGVAKTETLETAHIAVHSGSPRGDEPYVDNPIGCAHQGILTHISPKFISDKRYREERFGPTESVLVRIWAYFRWGLFEEHYDAALSEDGVEPAYDAGGRSLGTRCSANIEGEIMWPDYTPCNYGTGNNMGYSSECRFVPIGGQTVTSSLLFGTKDFHIPTINEFCDDDPESPNFHNAEALNLQTSQPGR